MCEAKLSGSMADDSPSITVSYAGRERRISLVVRPSLELSDEAVDQAEFELCHIVRHVFNIPVEAAFSLHEIESSRILTKESFRDPSYLESFPPHWYLTLEKTAGEAGEEEERDRAYGVGSSFDLYNEGLSDLEETIPSLAELSLADAKYQSLRLRADSNGLYGVTLRHFSIQPISTPAQGDSPPEFGSQNSQQSSTSIDILSTTFVAALEGAGQGAGLQQGDTVHMINGESIIRSNFSEITDLLAQCGSEISLMVLPKESDDLQFLYPQYTEGRVGEFTSGDERVIIRDIPLVVGSGTSMPEEEEEEGGREREGRVQPLGLYSFRGSGSSLDNTHSNSSSEQLPQDDRLIHCSIHDIMVQSPSRTSSSFGGWYNKSSTGTGSNSQLDRLDENSTYEPPSSWRPVANGDVRYDNEAVEVDPSWYQDPGEGLEMTSQPVGEPAGHKERVFRAHSQDSGVVNRVGLLSSGDEGSASQPMWAEDLGVVRVGRHSKKSLEMLTSLSTTAPPPRGMRRIQSDDLMSQQTSRSHSGAESTTRRHSEQQQHHHGDKNITPTAKSPPASYEDKVPSLPPARERPRKATRSYSSQRPTKTSRSRISSDNDDAAAKTAEILRRNLSQPVEVGEEVREGGSKEERLLSESTTHSLSPLQQLEGEDEGQSPDTLVTTPTIKVASEEPVERVRRESREEGRVRGVEEGRVRGGEEGRMRGSHTMRHGEASPPMSPQRFQSATLDPRAARIGPAHHDPMGVHQLLLGPPSRRLPIIKSTSAQTPYGEPVRERNIDEAVAASQGTSLCVQPVAARGALSMDTEGVGGGGVGIYPPPFMGRRHSHFEDRSAVRNHVPCAGMLYKKQITDSGGRKSGARSWKTFYTVLVGSHMVFYKDKKDADANKPCEEPPLEVVPGRADLTHGYSKKRNVFRVTCGGQGGQGGAEYLLQCDTSQNMLHWVTTIHKLNGGGKMVEQASPKPPPPTSSHFLTPGSPRSARRGSSPLPVTASTTQQRPSRKKGLVKGIKNALKGGKKGVCLQPSFGQLLGDCPMSTENKNVPLVVEMCVREVEEHGLDVEGLYRKPGMSSIIRSMVADIDKGVFEFEDYGDIHSVGSLLKKFFQDLQDPLIPSDRFKEFLGVVMEGQREGEQVTRLRGLVFHLSTPHYHTLRYLTAHLRRVSEHSEQNKMVLRNVAMVFGPTLMLPSGSEEYLTAMSHTFTIVELLCKHWRNVFDAEMCHEEVAVERAREREKLREEAQADARGLVSAQRTSSDPAVNSLKVKKDHALFNASPKMVRRIKNQFTSGSRNSYSGGEALFSSSLPARKHHNRSETLPSPSPVPSSLLSPSSQPVPASKWGRAGSSGTLQSTRPRDASLGGYSDLNPHARYGGHEEGRRENVGSIWRDQKGRGSERREGQSRSQLLSSHPPPPLIAHQKELLTSYQHPQTLPYHRHSRSSPSHESLHRSTTLPASPEHRPSYHHQPVSSSDHRGTPSLRQPPSTSSPGPRRKISYNLAVGEGYGQTHRSGGVVHHQRRSSDQLPYQDELREEEFSRSYAPPTSSQSGRPRYATRGHQLYIPQGTGDHGGQRSIPKSYH